MDFKTNKKTKKPFPTDEKKGSVDAQTAKSTGSNHGGIDHEGAKSIKQKKMEKIEEGVTVNTRLEQISKERADREYDEFLRRFNPFGSGDIHTAVVKAGEVGINGDELAELVQDYQNEVGGDTEDLDVVAILYDHILQMARNEIDDVIGYDFLNDLGSGTEFYVAGNYMATSYDYGEEAQEELQEKIRNADDDEIKQLGENVFVKSFLDDVEVELSNKGRKKDDEDDE